MGTAPPMLTQACMHCALVLSGMDMEGLVDSEADGWQTKGE